MKWNESEARAEPWRSCLMLGTDGPHEALCLASQLERVGTPLVHLESSVGSVKRPSERPFPVITPVGPSEVARGQSCVALCQHRRQLRPVLGPHSRLHNQDSAFRISPAVHRWVRSKNSLPSTVNQTLVTQSPREERINQSQRQQFLNQPDEQGCVLCERETRLNEGVEQEVLHRPRVALCRPTVCPCCSVAFGRRLVQPSLSLVRLGSQLLQRYRRNLPSTHTQSRQTAHHELHRGQGSFERGRKMLVGVSDPLTQGEMRRKKVHC